MTQRIDIPELENEIATLGADIKSKEGERERLSALLEAARHEQARAYTALMTGHSTVTEHGQAVANVSSLESVVTDLTNQIRMLSNERNTRQTALDRARAFEVLDQQLHEIKAKRVEFFDEWRRSCSGLQSLLDGLGEKADIYQKARDDFEREGGRMLTSSNYVEQREQARALLRELEAVMGSPVEEVSRAAIGGQLNNHLFTIGQGYAGAGDFAIPLDDLDAVEATKRAILNGFQNRNPQSSHDQLKAAGLRS